MLPNYIINILQREKNPKLQIKDISKNQVNSFQKFEADKSTRRCYIIDFIQIATKGVANV